jgi:hypothetical protein
MGTDATIVGWMVVAAIILAAFLIGQVWQSVFDPMPESISVARPGTMLVTYVNETHGHSETNVVREECDTTEGYYIEEMAADRLAEQGCVKVELKAMDGKVYMFTRLSIKARGW